MARAVDLQKSSQPKVDLCMAMCQLGLPISDPTFHNRFSEFVRMMAWVSCVLVSEGSHSRASITTGLCLSGHTENLSSVGTSAFVDGPKFLAALKWTSSKLVLGDWSICVDHDVLWLGKLLIEGDCWHCLSYCAVVLYRACTFLGLIFDCISLHGCHTFSVRSCRLLAAVGKFINKSTKVRPLLLNSHRCRDNRRLGTKASLVQVPCFVFGMRSSFQAKWRPLFPGVLVQTTLWGSKWGHSVKQKEFHQQFELNSVVHIFQISCYCQSLLWYCRILCRYPKNLSAFESRWETYRSMHSVLFIWLAGCLPCMAQTLTLDFTCKLFNLFFIPAMLIIQLTLRHHWKFSINFDEIWYAYEACWSDAFHTYLSHLISFEGREPFLHIIKNDVDLHFSSKVLMIETIILGVELHFNTSLNDLDFHTRSQLCEKSKSYELLFLLISLSILMKFSMLPQHVGFYFKLMLNLFHMIYI